MGSEVRRRKTEAQGCGVMPRGFSSLGGRRTGWGLKSLQERLRQRSRQKRRLGTTSSTEDAIPTDKDETSQMQECTQNTPLYARISTSCVTFGSRARRFGVCEKSFHLQSFLFGCSVKSVLFDSLFTNLLSDATFRIICTTDWNRKTPLCLSVVVWNVWPPGQSDFRRKEERIQEQWHRGDSLEAWTGVWG